MCSIELKSPKDGSILKFTVEDRDFDAVRFKVSVKTPWFTGYASASTYINGSPSPLFDAMAESWKGWEGQKTWADIDRQVMITGESDSTGHISLTVELWSPDYHSKLRTAIVYEAGQLERMAREVRDLLEATNEP